MPVHLPVPAVASGDPLTVADWNNYIADNINKLLNQAHRVVTVAQFAALTGLEDGDEVYLEVDASNGVMWHLRYVASEPTYKWRFLGGPPLLSEVTASETTSSTTYAALATAGPSIALPRAGDYMVANGFNGTGSTANNAIYMSYDIGGTGASDNDAAISNSTGVIATPSVSRRRRKTGLTAVTLTAKYRIAVSGPYGFQNRILTVRPVRLT